MTTDFPGVGGGGDGGLAPAAAGLAASSVRRRGTSSVERGAQSNVPIGTGEVRISTASASAAKRKRDRRDTILNGATGPGEGAIVRATGITGA